MYKEIFANRIRRSRLDMGMSQNDVSKFINITQSKIAKIELGTQEPDIETIGKMAELYGVSLDWIFGIKK